MTRTLGMLILTLACAACSPREPGPTPDATPLTIEAWKALPQPAKYEIDTFERLKQGNPKLQEPRAWEKFHRDVILPAKKRDSTHS